MGMLDREFFTNGARWRHKNLGFEVFIRGEEDGQYYLGQPANDDESMFIRPVVPLPLFTEGELEAEFEPIVPFSRYRLLVEDDWI